LELAEIAGPEKEEFFFPGECPADFFPALNPVEYDRIIIGDPASGAVVSSCECDNNSCNRSSYRYQNRKRNFQMPGSGQRLSFQSGTGGVLVVQQDLFRRSSCIRMPAFQSFFIDR
jgi:hypothetical protein